jgi:hypothetical protein
MSGILLLPPDTGGGGDDLPLSGGTITGNLTVDESFQVNGNSVLSSTEAYGTLNMESNQITGLANATAATGAAALGQVLSLQATTGTAGYPLEDATPNIIAWTAPNDGNMHRVLISLGMNVSSATTGGQISVTFTDPGGNVHSNQSMIAASRSAGFSGNAGAFACFPIEAGSTVTISQSTDMTAGAATLWAEIWGL